jgi:hypothetical protein
VLARRSGRANRTASSASIEPERRIKKASMPVRAWMLLVISY